jgi:hypothetical protein
MHRNYCPFCHLVVAPADPYRLERKGQAAHEGCVKQSAMPGVYRQFKEFLTGFGATFELNVLEIKSKTALAPRQFAIVVESLLKRLVKANGDADKHAAAVAFAAQAADKLYADIDVAVDASPVPTGPKKARRA